MSNLLHHTMQQYFPSSTVQPDTYFCWEVKLRQSAVGLPMAFLPSVRQNESSLFPISTIGSFPQPLFASCIFSIKPTGTA